MNTSTRARIARRGISSVSSAALVERVRAMSNDEIREAIAQRRSKSANERQADALAARSQRARTRSARLRAL